MIRVNLLPPMAEAAPTEISPVIPIAVVAGVPLIGLFLFHIKLKKRDTDLRTQAAQLQHQRESLQPILNQVKALDDAKASLNQRKGVIQQLESERLRYPQFMDDFVKLLPGNLWLVNLNTTSPQGGNTLTVGMDVVALDNYAIADLVSNLESSQIFTDVDLGAISATQNPTGQSLTFHVNTTYKPMNVVTDAVKKS